MPEHSGHPASPEQSILRLQANSACNRSKTPETSPPQSITPQFLNERNFDIRPAASPITPIVQQTRRESDPQIPGTPAQAC
ncbi:MAG: hypothetical protein ACK559_08225, partial [bacterium]